MGEILKPLVEMISNAPKDMLFNVSGVFEYEWQDVRIPSN